MVDTIKLKSKRSYVELMDLYEQNYIRLRCLIPDLTLADIMISEVEGYNSLHLVVKERCKYTTILNLTYQFKPKNKTIFLPDLNIRVYHDAQTAEVQNKMNRFHQLQDSTGSIYHQWKLNRFLYKWLGYCQHQGHSFKSILSQKSA